LDTFSGLECAIIALAGAQTPVESSQRSTGPSSWI